MQRAAVAGTVLSLIGLGLTSYNGVPKKSIVVVRYVPFAVPIPAAEKTIISARRGLLNKELKTYFIEKFYRGK
jgi:hypothetical protein